MDERYADPGASPKAALSAPAPVLSTREAAARLGIDERAVRRLIGRGELGAVRRGTGYAIALAEVDRYTAERARPTRADSARLSVLPPPAEPSGLPTPASSFVGRREELARLEALLRDPAERLLTLTGPGGVGKTRLALAGAAAACTAFSDGAVFVDLAPVRRPGDVLPAIAEALGLRRAGESAERERLRAYLRAKRLLLVLDNFEQVVAAAPDVADLLAWAPGATVLVTSRAPLRLAGERVIVAPPLGAPPAGVPATPDAVLASDAGRLFVERAEAGGGFAFAPEHAPAVAEICRRLDGQPLALELAAARLRLLSPAALLARLEPRLPLLGDGRRDAPQRQRTVRDAIAWSYDLLRPAERRAFRRLAVCTGGFTLEIAAALLGEDGAGEEDLGSGVPAGDVVAAGDDPAVALELVGALLDQSLLQRDSGPDGEPRFRMLETVREFGLERMAAAGEESAARAGHARAFLAFAGGLRREIAPRTDRAPLDRIEADWPNLRAALGWLSDHGPPDAFARLVAALPSFWWARSYHREARCWLERAHALGDWAAPLDRGWIGVGLAGFVAIDGDWARAARLCDEGMPLVRAANDPLETATALLWCGAMANYAGDFDQAEALLDESLALADAVREPHLAAATRANALANLADTARGQGDLDLAAGMLESALQSSGDAGSDLGGARLLADLGDLAMLAGESEVAVERYRACLAQGESHGNIRLAADSLRGIASAAAGWGQWPLAGHLFAAADAMRERAGIAPMTAAERERYGSIIADVRRALGVARADAAWAEGRALGLAEAIAATANIVPPEPAPASGSVRFTRRERDVLRLLAEHRTDREIAAELFLSPRTVGWHVTSILTKLGVASRREAVERALADALR